MQRAAHRVARRTLGLVDGHGGAVDVGVFERRALRDPSTARLVAKRRGLRIPLTADPFEALAVHTAANHAAIDFRVTVELDAGQMVIQGIEVFTVADDGLISAVSAYWDDADITFE